MNLNTKENRIKFGKLAEEALSHELDKKGIPHIMHEDLDTWTPYEDLKKGDIFVGNDKIDVKRYSITKRSIKEFEGDWFAITYDSDDIKDFTFIPARVLKKYVETMEKEKSIFPTNTSGKKCLKAAQLKGIRANRSFDDWASTRIKR